MGKDSPSPEATGRGGFTVNNYAENSHFFYRCNVNFYVREEALGTREQEDSGGREAGTEEARREVINEILVCGTALCAPSSAGIPPASPAHRPTAYPGHPPHRPVPLRDVRRSRAKLAAPPRWCPTRNKLPSSMQSTTTSPAPNTPTGLPRT